MNSQSRHDAPSVTPALKISVGFGVLSIEVFESNFQFWSSPLSIPNCTQQFLWTLQFNVALPDLGKFHVNSIFFRNTITSPWRSRCGREEKLFRGQICNQKLFFFPRRNDVAAQDLTIAKKNTALSWFNWYLRGLEKNKRPSTRLNCSEKGLLLFYDKLV